MLWTLSNAPENNRLVHLVDKTDFSADDKNEIGMAISAQTVRRMLQRLYKEYGESPLPDDK